MGEIEMQMVRESYKSFKVNHLKEGSDTFEDSTRHSLMDTLGNFVVEISSKINAALFEQEEGNQKAYDQISEKTRSSVNLFFTFLNEIDSIISSSRKIFVFEKQQ